MTRNQLEWIGIIVLATLIGGGWIFLSREDASTTAFVPQTQAPYVGNLAPDFTLTTFDEEVVSLADYKADGGRPVVVNFWATWCPPCRVEMPFFQRLSEQYDGQVAILGVNQAESSATIESFARDNHLSYPLLVDRDMKVNNLYGVLNLPTTIFIDKNGVVREVVIGTMNQAVLQDRIQSLLDS